MFCAMCGIGLQPADRFCKACGASSDLASTDLVPTRGDSPVAVSPVVVNIHAAPAAAASTVVVSDGQIVIGGSDSSVMVIDRQMSGMERLAIGSAVVFGAIVALTFAPVRLALMVLLPLPIFVHVWWLYAGEPRGGRVWSALGDSLPGSKALTARQRRAVTALIVGGGIWLAVFLLNRYLGAPFFGTFI